MESAEMTKDLRWIKENVLGVSCSLGFKCVRDGFASLCKVSPTVTDGVLLCVEPDVSEKKKSCEFADSFGRSPKAPYGYFCRCPVRIKIYKEHQK